MYGYVYKTTNALNGKVYIGQCAQSTFNAKYLGSGKLLKRAINKYGIENFITEIIVWCNTREELNDAEIYYIGLHQNNSYNIAKGGTGGNTLLMADDNTKNECFKKRAAGILNWYKSLSDEEKLLHNKKISAAKKGKTNGLEGRKQSRETIEKRNATLRANGWSDFQRQKHAEAMARRRGNFIPSNAKTVLLDGIVFNTLSSAAAHLGISTYLLSKGLKNGTINGTIMYETK